MVDKLEPGKNRREWDKLEPGKDRREWWIS